jgi:hypothetical protein
MKIIVEKIASNWPTILVREKSPSIRKIQSPRFSNSILIKILASAISENAIFCVGITPLNIKGVFPGSVFSIFFYLSLNAGFISAEISFITMEKAMTPERVNDFYVGIELISYAVFSPIIP